MDGPIAQIVALTCHGNAYLRGAEVTEFSLQNSTAIFSDRIEFVAFQKGFFGKVHKKTLADSPQAWFDLIKRIGATRIYLQVAQNNEHGPDRMTAAFIGGGAKWSMEAQFAHNRSETWTGHWQVSNRDAPDRRIWSVTYARVSEDSATEPNLINLADAATNLTVALREIQLFSATHDRGGFTRLFLDAQENLNPHGQHVRGYHQDLAPPGALSDHALTMLDACQKAWVFGGMGSWNDMGFDGEDQSEYERVSDQLYKALIRAIVTAANQSAAPGNA
jgi:hypothetical protein